MICVRTDRYSCQMFKTEAETAAYLKTTVEQIRQAIFGTGYIKEYQIYTIYQGD